jgi:hypothetical protein
MARRTGDGHGGRRRADGGWQMADGRWQMADRLGQGTRSGSAEAVLPSGLLACMLVEGRYGRCTLLLASAELYGPAANSFTPVDDMPLPGSEQAAVYVPE